MKDGWMFNLPILNTPLCAFVVAVVGGILDKENELGGLEMKG